MNSVIEKYKSVQNINNVGVVEVMWGHLLKMSRAQQQELWINDTEIAGELCLFSDWRHPGFILEYVKGTKDDSITTLYCAHPIFNTGADLIAARREIICEIAARFLSLPGTLALPDAGRERDVLLKECGTMQLLDTLRMYETNDSTIFQPK